MTFWDKVEKCKHENFYPDYYASVYCVTPYCDGYEVHCKDCDAFISQCGCRYNNGISGWSHARWRTYWKQREKKTSVRALARKHNIDLSKVRTLTDDEMEFV